MKLKEEIQKLVQLQKFDSQLYNLKRDSEQKIPDALALIKQKLQEKDKLLEQLQDKFKQLLLDKKDKELELASKEELIKKADGQLFQLKSNIEYQAKLKEIASLKADVSILEEKVLKAIDAIENAEKNLASEKEKITMEKQTISQEEAQLHAKQNELGLQMKTINDQRQIIAREVENNVLQKYEKLLETRMGLAIAMISSDNSCAACHMRATHQKLNEIKMYSELVLCDSCLRILYDPNDLSL